MKVRIRVNVELESDDGSNEELAQLRPIVETWAEFMEADLGRALEKQPGLVVRYGQDDL